MPPSTPDDLGFDPNQVTPGWEGFAATALIGLAIIFLMFGFFRRVTRINNRAEARERIEAELAEREAAAAAGTGAGEGADASPHAPSDVAPDAFVDAPDDEAPRT
jgi:hypothetical protein